MKQTKVRGRVWVLTTPDGELYDDIDTDMIFHNRYLHITDIEEMGQYALDNLKGWEDFANRALVPAGSRPWIASAPWASAPSSPKAMGPSTNEMRSTVAFPSSSCRT
jgi:hypothetical protein